MSFPALARYAPKLVGRLPTGLIPISARPAAAYLILNLMGFTFWPVHTIIQISFPTGTKGHAILSLFQSLPPTAPAGSLCSRVPPHVAQCGIRTPLGCEPL